MYLIQYHYQFLFRSTYDNMNPISIQQIEFYEILEF